jgi:hypothetical protein
MAIGDDAAAAGYPLVPNTGPDGLVRDGAQEINRSRDFVAQVKATVPVGKAAFRTAAGISSGTADPTGGVDGDIYFKILP